MLPSIYSDDLSHDYSIATKPGKTFALLLDGDHCEGMCDGVDAVKQAVYLILRTERYRWLIHSWDYGAELSGLAGQSTAAVMAVLPGRISEALMQDDRILSVSDFSMQKEKRKLIVSFSVRSVYGAFEVTEELAG